MKKLFYILTAIILVGGVSCNNANTEKDKVESKKIEIKYLEDFMQFKNHDQIVDYFGEENVKETTRFEEEGTKEYNVTIVNPENTNSIIVYWGEDKDWEDVEFVKNIYSNYTYNGKNAKDGGEVYPTRVGVELGMSLPEIQEINGAVFTFFGLAWDYEGFVTELNDKFNDYRLFVGYPNPDLITNCPDEYYNIQGDSEFLSENEDALKLGLELVSISYMEK